MSVGLSSAHKVSERHRLSRAWVSAILTLVVCNIATAESDYVPKPGEFPPPNSGQYFAGELVMVDPINRRGGLRLDADRSGTNSDRYDKGDPLQFAMLPYGMLWYHGAPAELRDIPVGTHLHGYFYLPPAGEQSVIPPPKGPPQYLPKYNHAISLEDDFSFYQRRGRSWTITSVDSAAKKFKAVSEGPPVSEALNGEKIFEFDGSTRVWKGRCLVELNDIAPAQSVRINLTWSPDWENRQFQCADIWLDQESQNLAIEQQRQAHVRYQHNHWLAGWVDHVKQEPNGAGIVTVTLFGGMDPSLIEDIKTKAKTHGFLIAVADRTLRTFLHSSDNRGGALVAINVTENPPLGSSGIQLQIQVNETLEGYRPGRVVRVRPSDWPSVKLPPEERMMSVLDP